MRDVSEYTGVHSQSGHGTMKNKCQLAWRGHRVLIAVCTHLLLLSGCTIPHPDYSQATICPEMVARMSFPVVYVAPGHFILPPDANFEDGVNEDEAVATALSNNSAFQATLAQLGIARGDLIQAGLLSNPNLVMFLPVSVKQWEWTLYMPMETFVLRPHRLAVAENDCQRVAQQLVQNGLNLVRDVRVAHADLALAIEQAQLGREAVTIRQSIADLTQKRLNNGDISELEAMTARIDALNAQATAALLDQNVVIAASKLALLMGLPPTAIELDADLVEPPLLPDLQLPALINQALAGRPDMQAAEWTVQAAAERTRLARWLFWRIDVGVDANGTGRKGFEAGPGFRLDIPIFNRNQGGIQRADYELTQAMHARDAIRDQIVKEVRAAAAQYVQAKNNSAILRQRVVPALDDALRIAEKGLADGGATYLLVLQTTSQYLDAKTRMLDQLASLRRSRAELERSAGRSLTIVPEDLPTPQESLPAPQPVQQEEGQP